MFISYHNSIKVNSTILVILCPHPTHSNLELLGLQLSEEDHFSNVSIQVSYQLQTSEDSGDSPQPILDLYTKPAALFQVTAYSYKQTILGAIFPKLFAP